MTQKQRWISACILLLLAIGSGWMSVYVMDKEQPENIAAFENRFLDLTHLGLSANKDIQLEVTPKLVKAQWQESAHALMLRTDVLPLTAHRGALINLTASGTQNASKTERWNYRIWLELTTFQEGLTVATRQIELPLESAKGRGRVYAVQADGASDSWQAVIRIEPLNGQVAGGTLTLSMWEVYAK